MKRAAKGRGRTSSLPTAIIHTSAAVFKVMDDGPKFRGNEEAEPVMHWRIEDVRKAIPPHLHQRQTWRGLMFYARDASLVAGLCYLATQIQPCVRHLTTSYGLDGRTVQALSWLLWTLYWIIQGLAFTSLWVIGHECGHGAISDRRLLCDILGFVAHSVLLTPYFSWKIFHHRDHMYHGSMEHDVVYIPPLKRELGITDEDSPVEDVPLYTLLQLVRPQLIALPAYLLWNATGPSNYPLTTSHFNPRAVIFKTSQRNSVILSDIGVLATIYALRRGCIAYGFPVVAKYYGVPWLFVDHWIAMITFLHHTDPELPHYRGKGWTFTRGALATLDRDFLGWAGRFFFHDVSHYHVIHHLFTKMPFYNAKEATEHLKACLGNDYHRSDKPVFKAMWDNYNDCVYVEESGDTVFYLNRYGKRAMSSR